MPKKDWPVAVRIMTDMAASRTGEDLIPADVRDITAYYYGSSPNALPVLPYHQNSAASPTFIKSGLGTAAKMPLVINIKSVQLAATGATQFLICDGGRNEVSLLTKTAAGWQETLVAEVQVPSHTEVVDYDLDGDKDIIVAALGLFPP